MSPSTDFGVELHCLHFEIEMKAAIFPSIISPAVQWIFLTAFEFEVDMKTFFGISALFLALSAPAYSQAITDLTAFQNGNCDAFGGGWAEFAYDGVSNITFCKKVSPTVPSAAIVDVNGIYPGHLMGCEGKFGAGWSEFAYDGTANVRYCKKIGNTTDGYVSDVSAVLGNGACENLSGRGWDTVVYNGRSNISFCAKFK